MKPVRFLLSAALMGLSTLAFANLNSKQVGYMQHAVFTTLDANQQTEDWTFLAQEKLINAHLDLQRTK
jgi:hypothetical protein